MASLTLRISLEGGRVTKTIQFDPNTSIFDACRIIRDKFAEAVHGGGKKFINDRQNMANMPTVKLLLMLLVF